MSHPILRSLLLAVLVIQGGCPRKAQPPVESRQHPASAAVHKDGEEHEAEEHEELPDHVRLPAQALAAAAIRTATVEARSLPATVDLTGEVVTDPDRAARITARVPGRIVDVQFKEGDRVKAGALLLVMESAEMARARAAFLSAQARAQSAQKNAQRLENLQRGGLASGQELTAAQAEAQALQAEAQAAQRTLMAFGVLPGELFQGSARLEVRAAIEGLVLSRNAVRGQTVAEGHLFCDLADLDRAYFAGRLFEKNLAHVRIGAAAEVRLNAYPGMVFPGTVQIIGRQLDPSARSVLARIAIQNRGDLLKVGLFGTARVTSTEPAPQGPRLVVPLDAVTRIGNRDTVFVRHADDDFEVHPVTLGRSAAGQVEILSGLRAGEQVVVDGVFTLKSVVLKSTFGEEH